MLLLSTVWVFLHFVITHKVVMLLLSFVLVLLSRFHPCADWWTSSKDIDLNSVTKIDSKETVHHAVCVYSLLFVIGHLYYWEI